ncbi:hypothetical protein RND81_09G140200 [Saponaria officinalis]|uniref:RING-type E3 ubiquitin transferase n=1 Tax=Saponaria officinalis TaxID=3572 RepID=A0AAW1IM72_SAPOF
MASYHSLYTHRKLLQSSNTSNDNNPTIQTCLYFCKTLKNDTVSPPKFCPTPCLAICPTTCQYSLLPSNNYPIKTNIPHNLSPLLISMLILLASFFLLITFYVLYTKLYSHFYHFTPTNPTNQPRDGEEPRGNFVFHPIWYIPTVGLNPTVVNSIKVYKYEKGFVESDCVVCLGEFIVGDEFRILPKCNHAFHVHCIDTWLMSHVTCPLCRAPVDTGPIQGYNQTREISTTVTIRDSENIMQNNDHTTEVVNNDNDNDNNVTEENKRSRSQRWGWERGAASLVSRSLSCSAKIFSPQYNNRPSSNS